MLTAVPVKHFNLMLVDLWERRTHLNRGWGGRVCQDDLKATLSSKQEQWWKMKTYLCRKRKMNRVDLGSPRKRLSESIQSIVCVWRPPRQQLQHLYFSKLIHSAPLSSSTRLPLRFVFTAGPWGEGGVLSQTPGSGPCFWCVGSCR